MTRWYLLAGLATVGAFIGMFGALDAVTPAASGAGSAANVEVLSADATGFTVALRLPAPVLEASTRDGKSCGLPLLAPIPDGPAPLRGEAMYGWLVGIPEPGGATVEPLEVTEQAWDTRLPACSGSPWTRPTRANVGHLLADVTAVDAAPRPRLDTPMPDSTAAVAALEPVGDLRGQSVARLLVRPIIRGPDGRLVFRPQLRLRVSYRLPASIVAAQPEPGPFATTTGLLLNHQFLPRRVRGRAGEPPMAASGRLAQADPSWTAPADPRALKVIVDHDGPVALSGGDMVRAGWDLATLDLTTLGLESGGRTVAFTVEGLADGQLAPATRLVFQGQAMTGLYTRENVYWLRPGGSRKVMSARDAAPANLAPVRAFSDTFHFEQDTRWLASLNPHDGDDRWMWGDALNAADQSHRAVTVTLSVRNLSPVPAAARVHVQLQGYTDDAAVSPDHHIRLLVNNRVLGTMRFDGMGVHVASFIVPAGTLDDGDNRLVLQTMGDTGAVVDQVFLNRVTLDLAAGYRAVNDRLDFAAPANQPGPQDFALNGFTDPAVTVLDVTDPEQPVRLTGVTVTGDGAGTYSARLHDDAPHGRRYVAFAPQGARPPARVVANTPSDWRSDITGADYIVITHPDFAAALQPLVARRQAQGLRTAVVSIDDVYDEFSFGVFDPRAIRSFLQHAYNTWPRPAPTYVLLVGESNLDYRRGYNSGPQNFVPSVTIDMADSTEELTTYTSDAWFVTLGDGDSLPDMFIGRFSVSTAEQASTAVSKTLRYENQPLDAPWRRRAILVADARDAAQMEPFSEQLVTKLPADSDVRRFFAARYPITRSIAADIGTAVDQGATVMSFAGHANVALWDPWPGGGYIFDNGHIAQLTNGDAMPLFMAATCMNGWIDHPLKPVSMTELWLTHPAGGGPAAWAPSGFSSLAAAQIMFPYVFERLYDGSDTPIGAAVTQAGAQALGQSSAYRDLVGMFILVGDPALVVSGVPPRPTPTPAPTATAQPAEVYLPFSRG